MKYFAKIDIMPLKALLDPQGKAVNQSLHNTGYKNVTNVRIGKHITFEIEAENKKEAEKKVEEACEKFLSNPVMEEYKYSILTK